MAEKITKPETEWQKQLSPEQFHVTRKAGTEPAFTGKYWKTKDAGTYACVCCGQPLFSSDTKFESGTGWPSFCQPVDEAAVVNHTDQSLWHGSHRGALLRAAMLIWGTFLKTGRRPPACAIA